MYERTNQSKVNISAETTRVTANDQHHQHITPSAETILNARSHKNQPLSDLTLFAS